MVHQISKTALAAKLAELEPVQLGVIRPKNRDLLLVQSSKAAAAAMWESSAQLSHDVVIQEIKYFIQARDQTACGCSESQAQSGQAHMHYQGRRHHPHHSRQQGVPAGARDCGQRG